MSVPFCQLVKFESGIQCLKEIQQGGRGGGLEEHRRGQRGGNWREAAGSPSSRASGILPLPLPLPPPLGDTAGSPEI